MYQKIVNNSKQEQSIDLSQNQSVDKNENLFGEMYCKLQHTIELGDIIIQHPRCSSKCYDLFLFETICLKEIKIQKQSLLRQLTQDEAILENNSTLELSMQKNSLSKKCLPNSKIIIVRVTTENMSALLGLSKSFIILQVKINSQQPDPKNLVLLHLEIK